MKKLLLIGAGQIGSRHLQALTLLEEAWSITVVDPSEASLAMARERAQETTLGKVTLAFTTQMPQGLHFDLAIIATNADVRFAVFDTLVNSNTVANILFEKVLFQSAVHIDRAGELLAQHGINAWVNCARRQNAAYQRLKTLFTNENNIEFSVAGSAWGLACNGIHFMDLFAFLTGEYASLEIGANLQPNCEPTKRKGCYEVFGSLNANSAKGQAVIQCHDTKAVSVEVKIESPHWSVQISETNRSAVIADKLSGHTQVMAFSLSPQSQLTHIVAADILERGDSWLPVYGESAAIHKVYLGVLTGHFQQHLDNKLSVCPIS